MPKREFDDWYGDFVYEAWRDDLPECHVNRDTARDAYREGLEPDEHAFMLRQTEIDRQLDRMHPDEIADRMQDMDKGPSEP